MNAKTEKPKHPNPPIRRAGDHDRMRHQRMCVVGLSGAGKTVLGTTVPDGITIVSESIALPTIRTWKPDQGVIEVANRQEMYDVLWWARDSSEARKYQTLVVDSATKCGDFIKDYVAEHSPDRVKLEKQGIRGVLSLGDWGTYYNELDRFMRALTSVPMHTLALAQAFEQIDETTRARFLRPYFEGSKFPGRFPGYFSLSGVIETIPALEGGGVDRRVVFEAAGGLYLVKSQRGLGTHEPPDVSGWLEKIEVAAQAAEKKNKK